MYMLYFVVSIVALVLVCFCMYIFVFYNDDTEVVIEKDISKYADNPDLFKKLTGKLAELNADGVVISKGKLNEVLKEVEKEISDEKIVSQQKEILENLHKIN